MSQAQVILEFWFGHPDEPSYGEPKTFWFNPKPEFDQQLRNLFLKDYQKAAAGYLNDWINSPETSLGLILLLDQFPRNMFRNTPEAFATDWEAVSAAEQVIALGYDYKFLPVQRWFIYLPFEHSENLVHQQQSVKLFQQLSHDPDSTQAIEYAHRHKEVIERFGRFPHRNSILGRTSTALEKEFLNDSNEIF